MGMSSNYKSLNFCSASPFGLSKNPLVKKAAVNAFEKYGSATTITKNSSASHPILELEKKIATLYGYTHVLTFSGATIPNYALISNLIQSENIIFYDAFNSGSLMEAIQFSKAKSIAYHHNDMNHLAEQLQRTTSVSPQAQKYICTSSVFVNEGEVCMLKEILELSKKYQCRIIIDDSFGFGYIDGLSRNILEYKKLMGCVDFVTGSFNNTLESNGGFIVYADAYESFMEDLKAKFPLDGLSAFTAASLVASLNILDVGKTNDNLRLKMKSNLITWKSGLKRLGLHVLPSKTNVVPIVLPQDTLGIQIHQTLQKEGLYTSYESSQLATTAYPYKLLTTITAEMTKEDIQHALEIMGKVILSSFPEALITKPSVDYLSMANPIKYHDYELEKEKMANVKPAEMDNFGYGQPKFAIIGMGCHFPEGIESKEKFWEMLEEGKCITKEVPADRWDKDEWYSKEPLPGTMQTKRGAFLENPYLFDNKYFYISVPEAKEMSPEQRWLCELTVETLEDANIKPETLKGSKTGVFIGSSGCDYLCQQISHANDINSHSPTGFELSILANRLSFVFDLQGPSISCNTACSSAFSALNVGLNSMITNDCDMAIVAGSNFMNCPGGFVAFSQLRVVSPTGSCKPFDEKADGYVRLEGAGMILIKPYEKAVRDGDKIYCAIMGCGSNEDGHSSPSLTMPSYQAQYDLLRHVCAKSEIDPATIDYVEAHGTGTRVGDPIEAHSIGDAYAKGKGVRGPDAEPLLISSVKGNTGHGENSSGIVGIIKASLMLQKRLLVPTVAYHHLNSRIPVDELGLKVVEKYEKWNSNRLLNVSVNSFGFGGANTNCLLQEVEQPQKNTVKLQLTQGKPIVATISGFNEKVVKEQLKQWLKVSTEDILPSLYLSSTCREDSNYRIAFVLDDVKKFPSMVKDVINGTDNLNIMKSLNRISTKPNLLFSFSGQGSQYPDMGRELYHNNPYFAQIIDYCNQIITKLSGHDLIEETGLFRGQETKLDHDTLSNPHISFLAIGITQLALIEIWKSYGITPTAVFGHSMGEVAAAYAAGILSVEDAILLLYHYGLIDANVNTEEESKSGMIALGCSVEEAEMVYMKNRTNVFISAINSRKDVTLAGDKKELQDIMRMAKERKVFSVELKIKKAFHSPYIKSAKAAFIKGVQGLGSRIKSPKIPFISSTYGQEFNGPFDEEYWWTNIISPVNFGKAAKLAHKYSNNVLEIGATPVLGIYLSEEYAVDNIYFSLSRKMNDSQSMSRNIARMYSKNCSKSFNWKQYWLDHMDNIDMEGLEAIRRIDYPVPKHVWDRRDLRKTYTPMIGTNPERQPCVPRDKLWAEFEEKMGLNQQSSEEKNYVKDTKVQPMKRVFSMSSTTSSESSSSSSTASIPDSPVSATPVPKGQSIFSKSPSSVDLNPLPSSPSQLIRQPAKPMKPVQAMKPKTSNLIKTISSIPIKATASTDSTTPSKTATVSGTKTQSGMSAAEKKAQIHARVQQYKLKQQQKAAQEKQQNQNEIWNKNQKRQQLENEYLDKKLATMYSDIPIQPKDTSILVHQTQITMNSNEIQKEKSVEIFKKTLSEDKEDLKLKKVMKDDDEDSSITQLSNEEVIIEVTDKLVHIILNRPEADNAFTMNMLERIMKAVDPNKILLIENNGKNFSLGWDLNRGGFSSHDFEESIQKFGNLIHLLESVVEPIICICKGSCRGGAMIFPLMADYTIAYKDANFGFPEVRRGGIPAVVTVAALKKLSRTAAKRMMILGNPIDAEEAKRLDMISTICENEEQCNEKVKVVFDKIMKRSKIELKHLREVLANHQKFSLESIYVNEADELYKLEWDSSKELVRIIEKEEGIVEIEMNSQENFNGMNLDVSRQLHACVDKIKERDDVKCVILKGYRRHFCTGADPVLVGNIKGKSHLRLALEVYEIYRDYASILELKVPIIGMINGRVVGGGLALALNCDWRIALDTTTIDFGNLPRGVCPGMMLSKNMGDYIKLGQSLDIYLQPADYQMSCEEGLEKGIVQNIAHSYEELEAMALEKAREMVKASKNYQGVERSIVYTRPPLDQELIKREAYYLADCAISSNMAEESQKWKTFSSKKKRIIN